jgi:DNA mismatch repair protein MutS
MTLFGWTDDEPLPIATTTADSDGGAAKRVMERLDSIDPDALTPREALSLLYELKRMQE